jgi:predicted site-specific integrase-resolvase
MASSRKPLSVDDQRIPRLVNTRKAAEILGRSSATLKRWRYEGVGPSWIELRGRVSYDVSVLLEYIRKNTRIPATERREHSR